MDQSITIRLAGPADSALLLRLAHLDSRHQAPSGEVLIGELCGEPVAALSVTTSAAVADPFRPTAAVLELLAWRAGALRRARREPLRLRVARGHVRAV